MEYFNQYVLKVTDGVHNWEIVQQVNGFANLSFSGIFEIDIENITQEYLPFEKDKLIGRIVHENDGSFVSDDVKVLYRGDSWKLNFENIPVGGPYRLDILMCDNQKAIEYPVKGDKRVHFCVGDVYLLMGQSNGAGMARGAFYDKPEMGIHVLRNCDRWDIATYPMNDFDYSRHGMFLSFAKKIKAETGVPVGLIPLAIGGAGIDRFIQGEYGDLYVRAINVLKRFNIKCKGVLWHQGCADAGEGCKTEAYIEKFKTICKSFRKFFADETLPFFTFQLNRQRTVNTWLDELYDNIREAQRRAAKEISNVFILPTVDGLSMSDFIHNGRSTNVLFGERLANQVLNKLYGSKICADAPEIKSAVLRAKKQIVLEFANVRQSLINGDESLKLPLQVKCNESILDIKGTEIRGNKIIITLKKECEGPLFVSAQTGVNPKGFICDISTQLPILCFCNFPVADKRKKG